MTTNIASKIYLTISESAQLLGCSTRTIRRRIDDGTLPIVRLGRLVRIPTSVITAETRAHQTQQPMNAAAE